MVQPVQAPVEIKQENQSPHKALSRKHRASANSGWCFFVAGWFHTKGQRSRGAKGCLHGNMNCHTCPPDVIPVQTGTGGQAGMDADEYR